MFPISTGTPFSPLHTERGSPRLLFERNIIKRSQTTTFQVASNPLALTRRPFSFSQFELFEETRIQYMMAFEPTSSTSDESLVCEIA